VDSDAHAKNGCKEGEHTSSEHLIDWFHITIRLTVLQQQAKGLQAERPQFSQETSKQLESVNHLLWHGNTEEALERIGGLNIEVDLLRAFSPPADKLSKIVARWNPIVPRLAVDTGDGKVQLYDTGDHRISGVQQHQSGSARKLTFTSQHGEVDLATLKPA
jgi:hypothetical protein